MERSKAYRASQRAMLGVLLAVFIAVVLLVNPLRETAMEDDWVYALTVRHLLDTGEYQLHVWAGANLPFQIFWGALFARLFGYSFSSLRISTLVLAFCGLVAFYFLAKEHDLNDAQAGLLTLGLFASPLVLRFSFNYMTDVPFLTCLIVALSVYARAIRLHSYRWMLLGSLAATAAILTRQFGMALIGGLLALWVLGKARREQVSFFLTGLALPALAALWQLYAGIVSPNWGARYFTLVQAEYMADPLAMLGSMLWRPSVILQYLALFSLPFLSVGLLASSRQAFSTLDPRARKLLLAALVPAGLAVSALALLMEWMGIGQPGLGMEQTLMLLGGMALALAGGWGLRGTIKHEQMPEAGLWSSPSNILLLLVLTLYVLAGILYGYFGEHLPLLMPYLGYNLYGLESLGRVERGLLALVTSVGAIHIARILVLRYVRKPDWGRVPPAQRLLDLVTLFLLLLQLVFAAISDQYLLVFLPFALIAMGRHMRDWLSRYRVATLLACLVLLVISALWTRGLLEYFEAYWQGGEYLLATGVPAEQVSGSWTWVGHYRFNDFVAEVPDPDLESEHNFFSHWLPEQKERAQYWVTETLDLPAGERWEVLKEIPYRDALLRTRYVYAIRRELSSQ